MRVLQVLLVMLVLPAPADDNGSAGFGRLCCGCSLAFSSAVGAVCNVGSAGMLLLVVLLVMLPVTGDAGSAGNTGML